MPTVHREQGFDFVIILGDHEPPHIHVLYGGAEAKIVIATGQLTADSRMKGKDLAMAKLLVKRHQVKFQRAWDDLWEELHGQR